MSAVSLRVALALPALEREAPLWRSLAATFEALGSRRAVDVEAFGELPSGAAPPLALPTYHYLRLRGRHAALPFDIGLYPLGRDSQPYEPAYGLMAQMPGVTWVLDPVLHHLQAGGVAIRGQWHEYYRLHEACFPGRGVQLLDILAAGWGSRAYYSRFDPMAVPLSAQLRVVAATQAIADALHQSLGARGENASNRIDVVPVGITKNIAGGGGGSAAPRLLILGMNLAWPGPTMDGLADVLAAHADVRTSVCVPEPAYHVNLAPAALARGIFERIDWLLSPGYERQAAALPDADLVAFLRDDPTAGEMALLQRAMALGKAVLLLRGTHFEALPEGVVAKVEPGRGGGTSLAGVVGELLEDAALRNGLADAARRFAENSPGPEAVADQLLGVLRTAARERKAAAGVGQSGIDAAEIADISSAAWHTVWARMQVACVPAHAVEDSVRPIREALAGTLPRSAARAAQV